MLNIRAMISLVGVLEFRLVQPDNGILFDCMQGFGLISDSIGVHHLSVA